MDLVKDQLRLQMPTPCTTKADMLSFLINCTDEHNDDIKKLNTVLCHHCAALLYVTNVH